MEDAQERNDLLQKITIGWDANTWVTSSVGRAIILRMEERRKAALERLAKITPSDYEAIRIQQNEVRLCDTFQGWIAELFEQGQQAYIAMTGNDET